MPKSEIEMVQDWLVKNGYPLEYETAREMTRVGYRTFLGHYYEDSEENRQREIDVRAEEPDGSGAVSVIAECKNNSQPWLALMTETEWEIGDGRHFLVDTTGGSLRFSKSGPWAAASFMNMPQRHGYNLVQVNSDKDSAYAALQQVTKAASGTLDLWPDESAIALPVIILGGSLYQLVFDRVANDVVERVPWIRVVWRGSTTVRKPVVVDVVTRDYLPTYLPMLRDATKELAALLSGKKRVSSRPLSLGGVHPRSGPT